MEKGEERKERERWNGRRCRGQEECKRYVGIVQGRTEGGKEGERSVGKKMEENGIWKRRSYGREGAMEEKRLWMRRIYGREETKGLYGREGVL